MSDLVECKYKSAGCGALLYEEDLASHYRLEKDTHMDYLEMKLQIASQTNELYAKTTEKSDKSIRKLKAGFYLMLSYYTYLSICTYLLVFSIF